MSFGECKEGLLALCSDIYLGTYSIKQCADKLPEEREAALGPEWKTDTDCPSRSKILHGYWLR